MWERHQREGVVIATSLALVAAVALVVSAYGHGMAGAAQAELFEWNTKTDPIFAGSEGDTVTGVDADDPNFNIKDLEYDSPFERMTSAEETRCPMCSGQREYHNNLYNLEHGGDATDIDSPEYRPDDEREGAAYEGGRGRVPAKTAAAGPMSEVSGPQGALQRMLVTVMAKMERNAEDYRLTDADQRREAAAARLLNKKRLLLKTEEAEIQEDMSALAKAQDKQIGGLRGKEDGSDSAAEKAAPVAAEAKEGASTDGGQSNEGGEPAVSASTP